MPNKLTVLIPCKNESTNIRACIESAWQVADEVLVADSGSTDGTLEIVRNLGSCRVIEREFVHYGDFNNWAMPQAKCPWVLLLDADERVTPQLAAEIRQLLATEPAADGYEVYRANYFMGRLVRHSGWGRDHLMRLCRRDVAHCEGDTDHAQLAVRTGRVGWLRGKLEHYTYWSYDQWFPKFQRYTAVQAGRWHQRGRKPSYLRMLLTGPLTFLRFYVWELGILDGSIGLQVSINAAFYSYFKQARLWEMHASGRRTTDSATPRKAA